MVAALEFCTTIHNALFLYASRPESALCWSYQLPMHVDDLHHHTATTSLSAFGTGICLTSCEFILILLG